MSSENYQAVYDAVRSKIGYCEIDAVVREVASDLASRITQWASEGTQRIVEAALRPSVVYNPEIMREGNQWVALYGDNLQDGVAGYGDSPADAMAAFDKAWYEPIKG